MTLITIPENQSIKRMNFLEEEIVYLKKCNAGMKMELDNLKQHVINVDKYVIPAYEKRISDMKKEHMNYNMEDFSKKVSSED